MSRRDPDVLLDDMRSAIDKIDRFVARLNREGFLADEKTIDAVVRNIEIIGEAAKQLPAVFKDAHPDIAWAQIAGLRNRVVHDYAGVDVEIIWSVVQTALPELKTKLAAIG